MKQAFLKTEINYSKDKIDTFYTISYKQGFIFCKSVNNVEMYQVRVDSWAYIIQVKSIRAAKIMITKHSKKYGGKK